MHERSRIAIQGLRTVFSRPGALAAAAAVFVFSLFLTIWIPNWNLLGHILFSGDFTLSSKLSVFASSFGNIITNFQGASRVITLAVLTLFSVNIVMVGWYLKTRFAFDRSAGTGLAGTLVGMLGIGCASCGSVLISALFGAAFTAGVVGALPFGGAEFGLAGIALLLFSIYLTAKKIAAPRVCKF